VANWALVIGIDNYGFRGGELRGAVNDAIAMREWLLRDDGGAVPRENLVLAIGARDASEHAAVEAFPGTARGIYEAVNELIQRSGGQGDRLFVHYSGHGIAAPRDWGEEQALVGSDFTPSWTTPSFPVRSMLEYFATYAFPDQFIFIDACRNIPWEGHIPIGPWALPYSRTPGQPTPQQFVLRSTSPGLKALDADELGNERGAFTSVLLSALAGEGTGKVWDWESERYAVTWERLVRYVKGQMEERRLAVDTEAGQLALQIPQDTSSRLAAGRDENPALVTFTAEHFEPTELRVVLDPLVIGAQVEVHDETTRVVGVETAESERVAFNLPPKTYGVKAEAPQFDLAVCKPPIELYKPAEARLELKPAEAEATPREGLTKVVVTTPDPLGIVELTDVAGRHVDGGEHTLELEGLDPGIYRARSIGPEGQVVERFIDLAAGETERVPLEPPEPASPGGKVEAVVSATDLELTDDGALVAADSLGPIAAPRVSTILSLAAAAAVQGREYADGERLSSLGLASIPDRMPADAECGLYVLLGADDGGEAVASIRLRTWPVGVAVPEETAALSPVSALASAGEHLEAVPSGSWWVAIERGDAPPVVFSLTALAGRVTVLVPVINARGRLRTFQYSLALRSAGDSDLRTVRRMELLQRCQSMTRVSAGLSSARELLKAKRLDPLAGCLGAYLMLRLGHVEELGTAVRHLQDRYGGLCDAHILRAEYEAHRGRQEEARAGYEAALDAGIPMFGEGLTRLLDGIGEFRISHPMARSLTKVHDGYLHGQLWLTWTPKRLVSGEVVTTWVKS